MDRTSGLLWATGRNSNDVYALSLDTLQTQRRVTVGGAPFGADLVNGILYVANFYDGTISRILAATRTRLLPDQPVGGEPSWVAADPVTGHVWIPVHQDSAVAIWGHDTLLRKVPTGGGAFSVAIDAVRRSAYVGNRDSMDVTVLNADTGDPMGTLYPGGSPFGMAVNPSNGMLYVLHSGAESGCSVGRMAIFNAAGVRVRDVAVGNSCPGGWVGVNLSNGRVYVAASAVDQVWVFEWDGALRSIWTAANGIGRQPLGLTVDPVTSMIYIANHVDNSITAIYDP